MTRADHRGLTNPDSSTDLYLQNQSPSADKLPAPTGKFILMLRMYWPREEPPSIIDGTWTPPAATKVTCNNRDAGPGVAQCLLMARVAALPVACDRALLLKVAAPTAWSDDLRMALAAQKLPGIQNQENNFFRSVKIDSAQKLSLR